MPSVLNSVLSAIQTYIQGAGTGISNSSIVVRKVDSMRDLTYPAIVISAEGVQETDYSNNRQQVTYRVKVAVHKIGNENNVTTPDAVPAIMEAIRNAIPRVPLSGVAESSRNEVGPAKLFPKTDFKAGAEAAYLTINAICLE